MVSPSVLVLAKCLEKTGGYEQGGLEARICAQKRIYLLQEMGLNLGYNFEWELYGPYSNDLAKDISCYMESKDFIDSEIKDIGITKKAEEIFNKANELFNVHKNDADWLELLASMRFLYVSKSAEGVANSQDKPRAIKELLSLKPKYRKKPDFLNKAIEVLQTANLL